ncbi:large conductance mechanosensitive channel protein MscL [Nonlabens antarcticus]|uniref:large conductance mechanosensitive channel protein MscL n=1 Tax=Nonlabens antarcticus TaxID=392714 RepID=UPI0018915541|nr:large conductance mechanosensitive channel protein MscL [Nonlabens antarcticus]
MLKEFKKFILTGNVIDLAVAVLLAGATALVVNGFVKLIMMPIVGHFTGGVDFSDLKIVLDQAVLAADGTIEVAENAILYGEWINTIINLIIVGFVLFMIVRAYNKAKKKEEAAPAAPAGPTKEEALLMEIRDAIKAKN